MVAEKKFRSDLYYRLKVFPIDVPPLRDRPEDIRFSSASSPTSMLAHGKTNRELSNETMDALARYSWPGNIVNCRTLWSEPPCYLPVHRCECRLAEILTDSGLSAASGGNALGKPSESRLCERSAESNWVVGGARGAAARLGQEDVARYKMQKLGISRLPQ